MSLAGSVFCSAWECVPALKTEGQGLSSYPRRGIVPSGWELFPKQFTVWVVLGKQELATLAGRAPELSPGRAGPLVLLLSSCCPSLVVLSSSGCLLSFSSPPLVLLLSSSCPLVVLLLSSSCPFPPILSFCLVLVVWLRWPTLRPPLVLFLSSSSFGRAGKPCVFLLLLVATFSNPVGPPGVPRCPRATVANPVSFFCCLSRSACPACPRCGPVYHRSYPGLVPCLATPFFLSPPMFHVTMNATVPQRSKCDFAIGSSHDIYPVFHRFAHVTQASGTGVFKRLYIV